MSTQAITVTAMMDRAGIILFPTTGPDRHHDGPQIIIENPAGSQSVIPAQFLRPAFRL